MKGVAWVAKLVAFLGESRCFVVAQPSNEPHSLPGSDEALGHVSGCSAGWGGVQELLGPAISNYVSEKVLDIERDNTRLSTPIFIIPMRKLEVTKLKIRPN